MTDSPSVPEEVVEIRWARWRAVKLLEAWRIREDDKLKLVLPLDEGAALAELTAMILEGVNAGLEKAEGLTRALMYTEETVPKPFLEMLLGNPARAMRAMVHKIAGETGDKIKALKV